MQIEDIIILSASTLRMCISVLSREDYTAFPLDVYTAKRVVSMLDTYLMLQAAECENKNCKSRFKPNTN